MLRSRLDRSVVLSRHRFADEFDLTRTTDEVISHAKARALGYHNICLASQSAVSGIDPTFAEDIDDLKMQEAAASSAALHLSNEIKKLLR